MIVWVVHPCTMDAFLLFIFSLFYFSFDDLRAGLAHMKRKAKHRSEGPIAFVKTNLSSTLDCLDSLQSK